MSSVVLRCSNCGTVQASAGQCEACHEAEVRYFCRNHNPGRWLDGPACNACGAQFGIDPDYASTAAPGMVPEPDEPRVRRKAMEPTKKRRPWGEASEADRRIESPDPTAGVGRWLDLIDKAARAHAERRIGATPRIELPRRRSRGGCGKFVAIVALIFFLTFFLMPVLFAGFFLGY